MNKGKMNTIVQRWTYCISY